MIPCTCKHLIVLLVLIFTIHQEYCHVNAAIEEPAVQSNEKQYDPILLSQILLWRKQPDSQQDQQTAEEQQPTLMNSPPKAERLPIPSSEIVWAPEQQKEQEPQPSQPDAYDQAKSQPYTPDYYDAVREEDRTTRVFTGRHARARAAPIMATSSQSEQPDIKFAPKTIFIQPPVNEELLNGGRVVAAMIPDGQGGFMPLDELVSSLKLSQNENSERIARLSAPQFSEIPSGDVLFIVDRNTGASDNSADRVSEPWPSQLESALKANFTPVSAEEEKQPQEKQDIPFWMFQPAFSQNEDMLRQPVNEDEISGKGILEAKLSQQKKSKSFYKFVASEEPIEVVGSTNSGENTPSTEGSENVQPNKEIKLIIDSETRVPNKTEISDAEEHDTRTIVTKKQDASNETNSDQNDKEKSKMDSFIETSGETNSYTSESPKEEESQDPENSEAKAQTSDDGSAPDDKDASDSTKPEDAANVTAATAESKSTLNPSTLDAVTPLNDGEADLPHPEIATRFTHDAYFEEKASKSD